MAPASGRVLPQLREVVDRGGRLDPRAYLGRPERAVRDELARPLRALCEEALALVDVLAEDADDELAGTCFAARLELKHSLKLLESERDRASMLVACDIARQGLVRSGSALLSAPAELRRDEAARGRAAALVRALYARLRQVVDAVDGTSGRRALLAVERALADAAARPEFAAVRLSDHFVLDNVRRRLAELAARAETDVEAIAETVSDAKAAVDLLAGIGNRPELKAYDHHVLASLVDELERGTASRALLVQVRELVRGRDAGLDTALAAATKHLELPPPIARRLLAEAVRTRDELAGGGSPGW